MYILTIIEIKLKAPNRIVHSLSEIIDNLRNSQVLIMTKKTDNHKEEVQYGLEENLEIGLL